MSGTKKRKKRRCFWQYDEAALQDAATVLWHTDWADRLDPDV